MEIRLVINSQWWKLRWESISNSGNSYLNQFPPVEVTKILKRSPDSCSVKLVKFVADIQRVSGPMVSGPTVANFLVRCQVRSLRYAEQLLFSSLCSKANDFRQKWQCFLTATAHSSTGSTDIRVHRACSQLKITSRSFPIPASTQSTQNFIAAIHMKKHECTLFITRVKWNKSY